MLSQHTGSISKHLHCQTVADLSVLLTALYRCTLWELRLRVSSAAQICAERQRNGNIYTRLVGERSSIDTRKRDASSVPAAGCGQPQY